MHDLRNLALNSWGKITEVEQKIHYELWCRVVMSEKF